MPKKRGAKPGNQNAYKQGYYSRNIPADIPWELSNTNADGLKSESNAIRVLMSRLAAANQNPDSDLKDPDAPYKMFLLASRRLDIVLTIDAELSDPLPLIAGISRDLLSYSQHSSDLYTIQNLERASSLMLGEKYLSLEKYAPSELIEKYNYILAQQQPVEEDDLEADAFEDNDVEGADEI